MGVADFPGQPAVFNRTSGRFDRNTHVTIAVRRLMKQAQVKSSKSGPHILRHSGAIAILRNGGDVFTLQQLMGHENIATTRKYLSSLGFDDVVKMHKKASPVDNLKL